MGKGFIRHAFLGGNTSLGFFSYYDYILNQEEANRIIVIKGGPGVGKSSFMRKVGEEMLDRGYDVEFMHCSSDNNSLDGVVIPAIKVALLDGTSPHVVDPKNPGVVDEIIHLGDYWNEGGLRLNREGILTDNREVGRLFARAYKYIKVAASVYENTALITGWIIDKAKVNLEVAKIIDSLFLNKELSDSEGNERKLFASAVTPSGYKNYLSSILTTDKIYILKGQHGTGTERLLEKVKNAAIERGFFVESFYCSIYPDKLEHIVIPEIGVSFTTSNGYHHIEVEAFEEIDLDSYLDNVEIEKYREDIDYNTKEFEKLMDKAIKTIAKAKALHDDMEAYYIPNMDFEAVQRCWEITMAKILEHTYK